MRHRNGRNGRNGGPSRDENLKIIEDPREKCAQVRFLNHFFRYSVREGRAEMFVEQV